MFDGPKYAFIFPINICFDLKLKIHIVFIA